MYATGSVNSLSSLFSALVTFLSNNSFTVDYNANEGSGRRAHLHKNGVYVHLRSAEAELSSALNLRGISTVVTGLLLTVGNGPANTSLAWNAQAGVPMSTGAPSYPCAVNTYSHRAATTNYHFFIDSSDNFNAVLEVSSGVYVSTGFGTLVKAGTWTGGQYFYGQHSSYYALSTTSPTSSVRPFSDTDFSSFLRADVDTFTNKWLGGSLTGSNATNGYTGKNYASTSFSSLADVLNYTSLRNKCNSSISNQLYLLPMRALVKLDSGGYALAGTVANVFDMPEEGYSSFLAGTTHTVGLDSYVVFNKFAVKIT